MSLMEIGEDEEIQAARDRLPEPWGQDKSTVIRVPVPAKSFYPGIFYTFDVPKIEKYKCYIFERKLLFLEDSSCFFAWVCLEDGKIYF